MAEGNEEVCVKCDMSDCILFIIVRMLQISTSYNRILFTSGEEEFLMLCRGY